MAGDLRRLPIRYGEFWDVPRIFVVECQERLWLFDAPFSDELDDYPNEYQVYVLPDDVNLDGPWKDLPSRGRHVGQVAVSAVEFDETKRQSITPAAFEHLPPA